MAKVTPKRKKVPQLYGVRVMYREGKRERSEVLVYCPFCDLVHVHGCDGLKSAHCRGVDAPHSYEVVLVPWTEVEFAAVLKYATTLRKEKLRLHRRKKR